MSSWGSSTFTDLINAVDTTMFTRATLYASAVLAVPLCPYDRLSVTSRHCIKTSKRRITQTTAYDRNSFLMLKI